MKKLIILLLFLVLGCKEDLTIKAYRSFIGETINNENELIVLRKFELFDKKTSLFSTTYIAINPTTLTIELVSSDNVVERNWSFIKNKYKNTPYIISLNQCINIDSNIYHNLGIKNTKSLTNYIITTDLCPSTKDFEYEFYSNILSKTHSTDTLGTPVGIAVTTKWMDKHEEELDWLINLDKKRQISITWINHSTNHQYERGVKDSLNFMLLDSTNVENKILQNEISMLKNGLPFSVYFRFPGLVSNANLLHQILEYGLIPLGSDAWIAKNEYPHNGSIVLLHGNGGEHIGISKFNHWLDTNNSSLTVNSINNEIINNFSKSTIDYSLHQQKRAAISHNP